MEHGALQPAVFSLVQPWVLSCFAPASVSCSADREDRGLAVSARLGVKRLLDLRWTAPGAGFAPILGRDWELGARHVRRADDDDRNEQNWEHDPHGAPGTPRQTNASCAPVPTPDRGAKPGVIPQVQVALELGKVPAAESLLLLKHCEQPLSVGAGALGVAATLIANTDVGHGLSNTSVRHAHRGVDHRPNAVALPVPCGDTHRQTSDSRACTDRPGAGRPGGARLSGRRS